MNVKAASPLVTVITAVRNGASHIRETMESVLAQDYDNIEYVVIDGASTDGTQNIVRSYSDRFKKFHFISEPDTGISDAWNKGVRRANGAYIAFLNADDAYQPTFIRRAIDVSRGEDIVYSDTLVVNEVGEPESIIKGSFDPEDIQHGFRFRHPSCVTSRVVFERCGLFDETIRIACDTDFLVRAVQANVSFVHSDGVVRMRRGGVSDRNWERAAHEYTTILRKYGLLTAATERRERSLIKLRSWNRRLRVAPKLRELKTQTYFLGLRAVNIVHSFLPFSLRPLLYKACAMDVDKTSCIQSGVRFFHIGRLKVGKNSLVNRGVYLDNRAGIYVGNFVSIAHDTKIYTLGHEINNDTFSVKGSSVTIEDHAVVFANALIMPGTRIGRGAVVLPGSVVTKSVDDFTVVGGNPAVAIRKRDSHPIYSFDGKYWFAH